jgi:hypothetical protein
VRFLLMCLIGFFVSVTSAAAQSPSWSIIQSGPQTVAVRVATAELKTNEYLAQAKCRIQFLDSSGKTIDERTFDFPVPVDAGKTVEHTFNHDVARVSSTRGLAMHYKIQVYGDVAAIRIQHTVVREGDVPIADKP